MEKLRVNFGLTADESKIENKDLQRIINDHEDVYEVEDIRSLRSIIKKQDRKTKVIFFKETNLASIQLKKGDIIIINNPFIGLEKIFVGQTKHKQKTFVLVPKMTN
ncbi:MAG: hypothetical protein QY321_00075 [Patescibacteria group bacterium]|nr:MAG: hypothetical protein QY321_04330 [Patescibacteria group bacterium]WKZ24823.1 MAG: hypothetical protein QY321_00075 [Patescibacteria group bacterium]